MGRKPNIKKYNQIIDDLNEGYKYANIIKRNNCSYSTIKSASLWYITNPNIAENDKEMFKDWNKIHNRNPSKDSKYIELNIVKTTKATKIELYTNRFLLKQLYNICIIVYDVFSIYFNSNWELNKDFTKILINVKKFLIKTKKDE